MANNQALVFNINQQGLRPLALTPKNRALAPNLPQGDIISAIIAQKNENGTMLTMENGESLNIRRGEVAGEVGDTVFFEVARGSDDAVALRQVFPQAHGQSLLSHTYSMQSLQDLMMHNDLAVAPQNPLDAAALAESHAQTREKAGRAVAKLMRSIDRIAGNTQGAAMAQLAAAGVNINKVSISMLDGITSQLDAALAQNSHKITEELHKKLDGIMNMEDGQIARMLQNGAEITLDNLYMYKHSGGSAPDPLPEADWQNLQKDIGNFFGREGLEADAENLARARFLLDNDIDLTADNFKRLIFLTDIEGNVDLEALARAAADADYDGSHPLGKLEIYNPDTYSPEKELKNVDHQLQMAQARLAMSYEANLALIDTDLEIDLNPQIEALKQLREKEAELLAALRALGKVFDTPENQKAIADTFRSIFTLPYISFSDLGAIAQNRVEITLEGLEALIVSRNYEAGATVASLKHGDTFNKLSEQFAPLLRQMGLSDDAHSIRAAKILTMNNMEINPENLLKIKTIDAKIADVQNHLHPRMAAQMIADGHNPAAMHVDEILEQMAKYNHNMGTNENDMLYRHIAEMDSRGDVPEDVRAKVIEIYQMLNKVSKNNGAGIGFAVNAGIELTLQNLLDFARNFQAIGAKPGSINYTIEDGTYYAKHLVSSFISAAKPRPLARFAKSEPLTEPLATSVDKIEDIAREMVKNGEIADEIDVEAINRAIQEMTGGKENARLLSNMGLPVTLANIRQLKIYRERKLDEDLEAALDEVELSAITDLFDVGQALNPVAQNENLTQYAERARENAMDAGKITKLDMLMQSLDFRRMMLENTADYSFATRFNGRIADVTMYVVNENMDVDAEGGVTLFMSLKTAMGDVQGLVNLAGNTAHIRFAANDDANEILAENKQNLADMMTDIGFDNADISFADVSAMKKQLSVHRNLPI
ncbi:MAG: DUF6240 domain-containing protein [Clostridiales bacterium]|jgi:type III secretion system FlhB-like substrate exporter|nr:DUF6240 domain-containing protein [Clostridiales bacterium]